MNETTNFLQTKASRTPITGDLSDVCILSNNLLALGSYGLIGKRVRTLTRMEWDGANEFSSTTVYPETVSGLIVGARKKVINDISPFNILRINGSLGLNIFPEVYIDLLNNNGDNTGIAIEQFPEEVASIVAIDVLDSQLKNCFNYLMEHSVAVDANV